MGETDKHAWETMELLRMLRAHFEARPKVYVAGDNFLYYEKGNPRACVSPDAYVVFGAGMKLRDCYKAWEEGGRLPDVVIEITSRKTAAEDLGRKFKKYEQRLRIPEYFLFDPRGPLGYLDPQLQGFRLRGGSYRPLHGGTGSIYSEQLDLELHAMDDSLRLFDPRTQRWLPTSQEIAQAARAAEAEVARLRAEIERLKARN